MKNKLVCITSGLVLALALWSVSGAAPQANPAPAQSGQGGDQPSMAAIQAACAEDAQKFCATVQPGGGRIVACLKEHKVSLSDRCRQAAGLPAKPSGSSAPSAADSPAKPSGSAAAPSAPAADSHVKPAAISKADPEPVVFNERWAKRTVVDAQQGGMNAVDIHLPESWHFEGKIEWHYGWVEVPVNPSWHAENPANSEAYIQYEALRLVNVEVAPQYRRYVKAAKPGERGPTGQINLAPMPPLQAMELFIKKTRGDVANLKWMGQQDLPELAKVLRLDPSPNQHGVAIKIGYDLDGKPVEEAFFGVFYLNKAGTQGVQIGQTKMAANSLVQTNWGFQALQSFRAPAGTLDKRMPVYCLIAKSVQYTPQWNRRYKAIDATLTQMFNQKLQQGWDQLRAAQAIQDQTMKDQAAFQANFDRQERAMFHDSGGGGASGGSGGSGGGFLRDESHDHFSDLMRQVDTMNDPSSGGTKEVSNLGGYNHFTDGFGHYRSYDSPNDTPENTGENGSWTRMTEAP